MDIIENVKPVADFLSSAQRFGLPMPYVVSVTGYAGVTIQVDAEEFDPWVAYTFAEVGPTTGLADGGLHHSATALIEESDVALKIVWVESGEDRRAHPPHPDEAAAAVGGAVAR